MMYIIKWKDDNEVYTGKGYHPWSIFLKDAKFFSDENSALAHIHNDATFATFWISKIKTEYFHPMNVK